MDKTTGRGPVDSLTVVSHGLVLKRLSIKGVSVNMQMRGGRFWLEERRKCSGSSTNSDSDTRRSQEAPWLTDRECVAPSHTNSTQTNILCKSVVALQCQQQRTWKKKKEKPQDNVDKNNSIQIQSGMWPRKMSCSESLVGRVDKRRNI